jgi:hypothetical protein
MVITFTNIVHGNHTREALARVQKKSLNWITEVLQDLEKEGFIVKNKSYALVGSRIAVEVATTPHAIRFKELIFQYPTLKFEEILADSKLLYLVALSKDWISTDTAAKLSKTSKYAIARYRASLKQRGIIMQKGRLYKVNEKSWSPLRKFLKSYKKYARVEGSVRWKYQDELLVEVESKEKAEGTITGFARYGEYGIRVRTISTLCKLPLAPLSKEEVFVHSLFEVNDPRTLYLTLVFYLKNHLKPARVVPIAMKYGKYTVFEDFLKILKSKEEKIPSASIPSFSRKEFREVARLYGVKDV